MRKLFGKMRMHRRLTGKKGAAIGTAVGAGSGALYTYKLRKRHRRHYRRY